MYTGGIIWEVEGRGSGSKGVAYHTDSPTQVEDPSTFQIIPPVGMYRLTMNELQVTITKALNPWKSMVKSGSVTF